MSKRLERVKSPSEIKSRLKEVKDMGLDLHPEWGVNLLIPPKSLKFSFVYPFLSSSSQGSQDMRTSKIREALASNQDVRSAYVDLCNQTAPHNNPWRRKPLKTTLSFGKDWKWVSSHAVEKAFGVNFVEDTFGVDKWHYGRIFAHNKVSPSAFKELWSDMIKRMIFEHDDRFWMVECIDLMYSPDPNMNLMSYAPSRPHRGGKRNDDDWEFGMIEGIRTAEDLREKFIHQVGVKFKVFMWDKMPQVKFKDDSKDGYAGKRGEMKFLMKDGSYEHHIPYEHPSSLILKGEGVCFNFHGMYHGKLRYNPYAIMNYTNDELAEFYSKAGVNFTNPRTYLNDTEREGKTFTGYGQVSFDSISPIFDLFSSGHIEYNMGVPIRAKDNPVPSQKELQLLHPTSGYRYYLMRGSPTKGILNRNYMW